MNTTFITCECHAEAIEVTRWDDEDEVYLSFWYYGNYGGKIRMIDRLRNAWKVISTGRPHPDHLIIKTEAVPTFVKALTGEE